MPPKSKGKVRENKARLESVFTASKHKPYSEAWLKELTNSDEFWTEVVNQTPTKRWNRVRNIAKPSKQQWAIRGTQKSQENSDEEDDDEEADADVQDNKKQKTHHEGHITCQNDSAATQHPAEHTIPVPKPVVDNVIKVPDATPQQSKAAEQTTKSQQSGDAKKADDVAKRTSSQRPQLLCEECKRPNPTGRLECGHARHTECLIRILTNAIHTGASSPQCCKLDLLEYYAHTLAPVKKALLHKKAIDATSVIKPGTSGVSFTIELPEDLAPMAPLFPPMSSSCTTGRTSKSASKKLSLSRLDTSTRLPVWSH